MIRAILFDMDGVVIDSEPLYEKAEERLFKPYGFSIPHDDQKDLKGVTEEQFYDLVEMKYQPEWDREEVMAEGRRLLEELFSDDLQFMEGFTSLIYGLKGHYLLGLVTSTPGEVYRIINRILPMAEYFDDTLCGDDTSNSKPHPEPYLTMMERLRVAPGETVVVEDSVHGIESALKSGAICVALASSLSRKELRNAHRVIDSLHEIDESFLRDLVVGE